MSYGDKCNNNEKMNFSIFNTSTDSLYLKDKETSCWSRLKSMFNNSSDIATNDIIEESAKYQRRRTQQFQIGTDDFHTRIMYTEDDNSFERQFESKKNGILKPKKVNIEGKYGLLLPANRNPPKCLLVSKKDDQVFECLRRAADKAGFDSNICHTNDTVLEEFQLKFHDLVLVDTRNTKTDTETLCRSIRNTKGSQHTVIVAVVKRSVFEKDDVIIPSLLDAGYNRCLVESSNVMVNVNELMQLKHSDIRPQAQLATAHALYAALDKSRDLVHITDETYRVQYTNRSSERYLGYRQDELIGKSLTDQFISDSGNVTLMTATLQRLKEWEGSLMCKRKSADPITTQCKVVPICTVGRSPTHFVFVQDIPGDIGSYLIDRADRPEKPRGSVHSLRRGSFDVRSIGSDINRRTSLAKLHAMPLEAPITKVIGLICSVQETSTPVAVQMLDKVIDILRSTELYSPQMKEDHRMRSEDPVTTDLIGALLGTVQNMSSRRSSNDSTIIRNAHRHGIKHKVPAQLKDLLDTTLSWDFDIFRLEELTNKRPLVHIGMNLFNHFDICSVLNCDEKTVVAWLTVIENNYHIDNSYHNSTHAADVLQATAGFLEKERMKAIMEPMDEITSMIAAIAHDIDHPGKSSAFLCNSDNQLAILYNDISVLESHHAALTFKLTLSDERVNIFKNLDKDQYKIARHNVVDMILATEMTKHFEYLAKFVNVFCTKPANNAEGLYNSESEENDFSSLALPENIQLVKRMMIKCADVSNPTRPLRLCLEWARRIAEEYFNQTDEEKAKSLPVVMPMFDRTSCSIPKSQIGFIDFIINDMIEAWDAFIDMPELITHMKFNKIKWKEFDEQGLSSLHDIKRLQATLILNPKFVNTPTTPE